LEEVRVHPKMAAHALMAMERLNLIIDNLDNRDACEFISK
jgi:hypothetical protein